MTCVQLGIAANAQAGLIRLLDQQRFEPVSEEKLDKYRVSLLKSLANIPAELDTDAWSYLKTDEVSRHVRGNTRSQQAHLNTLIGKLAPNKLAYDHPPLWNLRVLAQRYSTLVDDRNNQKTVEAAFEAGKHEAGQILRSLSILNRYSDRSNLSEWVRWCIIHEQALEFAANAQQKLSFPNFEMRVPSSTLRALTAIRFDDSVPIERTTDGVQTKGVIDFQGKGYLEPEHSSVNGVLRMRFEGDIRLWATNAHRRIHFSSAATTLTAGSATLIFDDKGRPAVGVPYVTASTELSNSPAFLASRCRLGARLVERAADRIIARKTTEAEEGLAREFESEVGKKVKERLTEAAQQINEFVDRELWSNARLYELMPRDIIRRDVTPREFSIRTTDGCLRITATEELQCGLAAPGPCPMPSVGAGFAAIHETLATDSLNAYYTGNMSAPKTLDAESLQRLNDALPPSFKLFNERIELPDGDLWSLKLDRHRPFRVTFTRGLIILTLRSDVIYRGGEEYRERDVTLTYQVSMRKEGFIHLKLQGAPTVLSRNARKAALDARLTDIVNSELLAGLNPELFVNLSDIIGALPLSIPKLESSEGWLIATLEALSASDQRLKDSFQNQKGK